MRVSLAPRWIHAAAWCCCLLVSSLPGPAALAQVDPRPRAGLSAQQLSDFQAGLALFRFEWPLSASGRNEDQCSDCHFRPAIGGVGNVYHSNVWHGFTPRHSSREIGIDQWPIGMKNPRVAPVQVHFLGEGDGTAVPIPPWANAMSRRIARPLFGIGSIEQIRPEDLAALADPNDANGDGISGRALGRYGSQGQWSTIDQIVREVLTEEVGVAPEFVSASAVQRIGAFLRGLRDPLPYPTTVNNVQGEALFVNIGCADCHVQRIPLPSGRVIRPYSDFLVHDMGNCLDDGVALGAAETWEWRTPPLWDMQSRSSLLLHDGRGARMEQVLPFHCGEAMRSRDAWYGLSLRERDLIKLFLTSLNADF